MAVKIQRWGNSLGLRISKVLAEHAHIRDGTRVDVRLEEGRLVVAPLRARKKYRLEDLLAHVTPENLHGETPTGGPVGKEDW